MEGRRVATEKRALDSGRCTRATGIKQVFAFRMCSVTACRETSRSPGTRRDQTQSCLITHIHTHTHTNARPHTSLPLSLSDTHMLCLVLVEPAVLSHPHYRLFVVLLGFFLLLLIPSFQMLAPTKVYRSDDKTGNTNTVLLFFSWLQGYIYTTNGQYQSVFCFFPT